ncbi:MAG: phosphodiester glycosidase family protein [Fimbriimonadaceae bacterium]
MSGFRLLSLRVGLAAAVAAVGGAAPAQVWEKLMAPGLTYRMEVDLALPRVVHALRWTPHPGMTGRAEVARGTVYTQDVARSRDTVSGMVRQFGAVAGINADFFPFTGDPLGLMVRAGELVSPPGPRSFFAWGDNGESGSGRAQFRASIRIDGGEPINLDSMNEEVGSPLIGLQTPSVGFARWRNSADYAVLRTMEGAWTPTGTAFLEVVSVQNGEGNLAVPPDGAILVATGARGPVVARMRPGQVVRVDWQTTGADWSVFRNAVAGGPSLVSNGQVAVDSQGFNDAFIRNRHPRTAIGRTAAGDIWLVAIDGRQPMSIGATLEETAWVMRRLGCVDAINLDGGGSTALNLFGLTLNRPSDGREREVANGVLLFGPAPATTPDPLTIRVPLRVVVGQPVALNVFAPNGALVPGREVLWAAMGRAWIDQGGVLRPMEAGPVTVMAWARGRLVTATIEIAPADPPPTNSRSAPPRDGAAPRRR